MPASLPTCLKLAFWCTAICCELKLLLIDATSWHIRENKHKKPQQTIKHGLLPREADSVVLIDTGKSFSDMRKVNTLIRILQLQTVLSCSFDQKKIGGNG